jgi:hypothetical protein
LDIQQLAGKIIPQCSILLLDKSKEVRSFAISLMENSLSRIKEYHQQLAEAAVEASKEEEGSKNQSSKDKSTSSNQSSSMAGILGSPMLESWTTWSMQGISKAIDGADGGDGEKRIGELNMNKPPTSTVKSNNDPPPHSNSSREYPTSNVGGINDDDDEDNYFETKSFPSSMAATSAINNWGDDDLDSALRFDDDLDKTFSDTSRGKSEDGNRTPLRSTASSSNISANSSTANLQGISTASSITSSITDSNSQTQSSKSGKLTAKIAKIAVKKLDFKKGDDWEDF